MSESVKIVSIEVENVKRVKLVRLDCSSRSLTVIGGKNRQGKTSLVDAVSGALLGDRYKPSNPIRDGEDKGVTTVKLSNGIAVTRTYTKKGSYLKVDGPNGQGTQETLRAFIPEFALDVPKFLASKDGEKADILLRIIGVDLKPLEAEYQRLYDERLILGREQLRQQKHAEAMPHTVGIPDRPLVPAEILAEMQIKLAKNAENARLRDNAADLERQLVHAGVESKNAAATVQDLKARLVEAEANMAKKLDAASALTAKVTQAKELAATVQDEELFGLEQKLKEIEDTNAKIRQNLDKDKAEEDSKRMKAEYDSFTCQIQKIVDQKNALLAAANLPLPGLSVLNGGLTLDGKAWDCMSHSDQLRAAAAIVRRINPKCGFVFLDKLEAYDLDTLREFGAWAEAENLQIIGTRVSTGPECSIIIEDGAVAKVHDEAETEATAKTITFKDEDF